MKNLKDIYNISLLLFAVSIFILVSDPLHIVGIVFLFVAIISMAVLSSLMGKRKTWSEQSTKEKIITILWPTILFILITMPRPIMQKIPIPITLVIAFGLLVTSYITVGRKIYKKPQE